MRMLIMGAGFAAVAAVGALAYTGTTHKVPSEVGSSGNPLSAQMGHGQMGMGSGWPRTGFMARHHAAMTQGIPEPYRSMTNPLPQTQETLARGAKIYATNCVICHGPHGRGDGPAATSLKPRPGNLEWLADRPMGQWDPFIYWTVAEGGARFGSAMPAYKASLSSDQIWAVTAYIQAHMPHVSR